MVWLEQGKGDKSTVLLVGIQIQDDDRQSSIRFNPRSQPPLRPKQSGGRQKTAEAGRDAPELSRGSSLVCGAVARAKKQACGSVHIAGSPLVLTLPMTRDKRTQKDIILFTW